MPDAEVIRLDTRSKNGSESAARARCAATTSSGRPCRNYAVDDSGYCHVHSAESSARNSHPSGGHESEGAGPTVGSSARQDPVEKARNFIRRRLSGDYPIDDFGYDRELSRE